MCNNRSIHFFLTLTSAFLIGLTSCITKPDPSPDSPLRLIVEVKDPATGEINRFDAEVTINLNQNPNPEVTVIAKDLDDGLAFVTVTGPSGGFTCQDLTNGIQAIGDNSASPVTTNFNEPTTEWRAKPQQGTTQCSDNMFLVDAHNSFIYEVGNTKGETARISVNFSEKGPELPQDPFSVLIKVSHPLSDEISIHESTATIELGDGPTPVVEVIANDPNGSIRSMTLSGPTSAIRCMDASGFEVIQDQFGGSQTLLANDLRKEWRELVTPNRDHCGENRTLISASISYSYSFTNTAGISKEVFINFTEKK